MSDDKSELRLALTLNGREVAFAWGEYNGYATAANSLILNLNRNDRVQIRVSEGRLHEPRTSSRGYTTFSGFRIGN